MQLTADFFFSALLVCTQALTNRVLTDVFSRTRVLCYFFVNAATSILKYLYVLNKKYFTCIPREHKPFLQLNRLDEFDINAIANLFVHERLKVPEAYSESSRTSRMELFANLVYG